MTLDDWLARLYDSDLHGRLAPVMERFKTVLADDGDMLSDAVAKRAELERVLEARGRGACTFSAKYFDYLKEATL